MQTYKLISGCFCECCSFSIFPLTKQIKRNYFNALKNETKQLLKQTNWINQVANPFEDLNDFLYKSYEQHRLQYSN